MTARSASRRSDTVAGAVRDLPLWQGLRAVLRHDPLTARSRKLSAAGASDRRVLLTFPRAALLAPDDPAPLLALVGGELPATMAAHWATAEVLHLGLDEAETGGAVRKLYLEFAPDAAPEPDLAYLALKCGGGRQALHRYDRVAEAGPVLAALDLPPALAEPTEWLARRSGDLLRVAEPGSARLSLDIGLADLDGRTMSCPSWRIWPPPSDRTPRPHRRYRRMWRLAGTATAAFSSPFTAGRRTHDPDARSLCPG